MPKPSEPRRRSVESTRRDIGERDPSVNQPMREKDERGGSLQPAQQEDDERSRRPGGRGDTSMSSDASAGED